MPNITVETRNKIRDEYKKELSEEISEELKNEVMSLVDSCRNFIAKKMENEERTAEDESLALMSRGIASQRFEAYEDSLDYFNMTARKIKKIWGLDLYE